MPKFAPPKTGLNALKVIRQQENRIVDLQEENLRLRQLLESASNALRSTADDLLKRGAVVDTVAKVVEKARKK